MGVDSGNRLGMLFDVVVRAYGIETKDFVV